MTMYKAYITYVKNIRPAENSDFLNACEVFGNTTIIDKTITEDTLVLYLPQMVKFLQNLVRKIIFLERKMMLVIILVVLLTPLKEILLQFV